MLMEKSRPQLSADELQQLRWLLGGLLILIAISTVAYMDVDAWLLAIVATAAVVAVVLRPGLPARVPPLAHRLAFPFIAVFAAWDYYTSAELLPAMIHLDFLLLVYRAVSYRKKRDDLQIIVLGLFLVIVAGVLTESLTFALHILVFTAGTLAFLFVITLTESGMTAGVAAGSGMEPGKSSGRAAPPAWTAVHWRHLFRRLREIADWRLIALGGALFIGVVAVSAFLFLAIPRFQVNSGFFLDRLMTKRSRAGFSDSIRLGDVVDIQQDNSIALRVDVSDPSHIPSMPYWRMVVLDEYRDGEFRTSRQLKDELARSTRTTAYLRGLPTASGWPVAWTFYLEAGVSRYLPIEGPYQRVQFREAQQVQENARLRVVSLRNDPVTMTAYRVEGLAGEGYVPDRFFAEALRRAQRIPPAPVGNAGRPGDSGQPRNGYPLTTLELPGRPADVVALQRMAGQIAAGGVQSAAEFSERARLWLTGRHAYSLQVELPGGDRDRVVAWMESGRSGYCELFATAFTLLARAAGYPTRVVTGFKGGDWNAYEDYFMVRNSDAHAWCEIFDGRAGWIRVDPTDGSASGNSGAQAAAGQSGTVVRRSDRTWSARLDAVRILWYRRIVSFDQRTQFAVIAGLKDTTANLGAAMRELMGSTLRSLRSWGNGPRAGWRILSWFSGATATVWGAVLLWRRGSSLWWRRAGGSRRGKMDPVRREAGRWLRKFGECGASPVEDSAVLSELQRLRYGSRSTWAAPTAVFRRARRAMRKHARIR